MDAPKRYHSVQLDKSRCKGCTNCLMHCPTEAIRVRDGRAHIIAERCIDCGECIRICDYHAKVAVTDKFDTIKAFRYAIALPAPSLYGQFRNLQSVQPVLSALKKIGFDDVFEVARGADIVSRAIAQKLREPNLPRPLISSACPAVVRLIQVRFPDLIPHIVDVRRCGRVLYHPLPGQDDGHPLAHWPAEILRGRGHLHDGDLRPAAPLYFAERGGCGGRGDLLWHRLGGLQWRG